MDDVRLMAGEGEGGLTLRDKIGVAAKAESVGNLFFAGRPAEAPLRIVNTDAKGHRVEVRTSIVDWEASSFRPRHGYDARGHVRRAGRRRKEATLPIDTGRRGTFRLGFELSCEGQTWRQAAELKYAVIVPLMGVGNAKDSVFAMNTHMEREPTAHLARNMEVLSQCGVKWIRGWWGWGMCEKERGKFDWSEYDRQFNAVAAAKMRIMPILLRYYSSYEQAWTGPISRAAGFRPVAGPYPGVSLRQRAARVERVGRQDRRALPRPDHRLRDLERADDGQFPARGLDAAAIRGFAEPFHAGDPPAGPAGQGRRFCRGAACPS